MYCNHYSLYTIIKKFALRQECDSERQEKNFTIKQVKTGRYGNTSFPCDHKYRSRAMNCTYHAGKYLEKPAAARCGYINDRNFACNYNKYSRLHQLISDILYIYAVYIHIYVSDKLSIYLKYTYIKKKYFVTRF